MAPDSTANQRVGTAGGYLADLRISASPAMPACSTKSAGQDGTRPVMAGSRPLSVPSLRVTGFCRKQRFDLQGKSRWLTLGLRAFLIATDQGDPAFKTTTTIQPTDL
jgi:hypothetical protein